MKPLSVGRFVVLLALLSGRGLAGDIEDMVIENGGRIIAMAGSPYFGQSFAVGDFNGDGRDEIAFASTSEDITSVYVVSYDEIFSEANSGREVLSAQEFSSAPVLGVPNVEPIAFRLILHSGDVSGNGIDDLLISNPYWTGDNGEQSGRVYVVLGHQGFMEKSHPSIGRAGPKFVRMINGNREGANLVATHTGDLYGDGKADLVLHEMVEDVMLDGAEDLTNLIGETVVLSAREFMEATASGDAYRLAGSPGLRFREDGDFLREFAMHSGAVAIGDFDGDGQNELALASGFSDGRVIIIRGIKDLEKRPYEIIDALKKNRVSGWSIVGGRKYDGVGGGGLQLQTFQATMLRIP